jgi:hypothetical protein
MDKHRPGFRPRPTYDDLPMTRRARRPLSTATGLPSLLLGVAFALFLGVSIHHARQPGDWQRVLATREGMIGSRTATGEIIRADAMFVALPHPSALGKLVELRYRSRALVVPVGDVGPWNVRDAYWESNARPAAERGQGYYRRPANRAGIDLSNAVFAALGLPDNDVVEWRFVHRGFTLFHWL